MAMNQNVMEEGEDEAEETRRRYRERVNLICYNLFLALKINPYKIIAQYDDKHTRH